MWAVKVNGFCRAEFRHFASAAEFVETLPAGESESAIITASGTSEADELRFRLSAWKRERVRMLRRERTASKWGAM